MGDVLTFTPRARSPEPASPEPLNGPTIRASLEEAAQVALDAADRIIAVLDRMDGDTDLEDGADAEPSLAAPENHTGSQVVWMRGNDADREIEVPEAVLPEVAVEAIVLPWRGRGNVVAAAGVTLLDLLGNGLCVGEGEKSTHNRESHKEHTEQRKMLRAAASRALSNKKDASRYR